MEIEVVAKVECYFKMSPDDVSLLIRLSEDHPSARCRSLTQSSPGDSNGGVLRSWEAALKAAVEEGKSEVHVSATSEGLELLVACMDYAFNTLREPAELNRVAKLRNAFLKGINIAREKAA